MFELPTVERVAAILARAPADQPWRNEGPARHLIRQALCRTGWKWWLADRRAFALVARARIRNGVRQPAGWDSVYDPYSWVIIGCCPICDRPCRQGRDDRTTYCSAACRDRADRIREREQLGPVNLRCWHCAELLIEPRPDQRYCNEKCRSRASALRAVEEGRRRGKVNHAHQRAKAEQIARETVQPRICPECDGALPPGAHRLKKFCSPECKRAVDNRNPARKARRAAKLNGANGHDHANGNGLAADARSNGAGSRERGSEDRAGARAGAPRASGHAAAPAAPGSAPALGAGDG